MVENEIKKVSKYLQLPLGKLSYAEDSIIQMKLSGDEKLVGYSSIINHLHNIHEKENKKSENYFLAKQFFDYANLFIRSSSKKDKCKLLLLLIQFNSYDFINFPVTACMELNSYLETRTYFIGQNLSIADVVVFYSISEIMKQLSPSEKEQFLNLSRWYDHLQQHENIRQGAAPVNFSTIHLAWNVRA